MSDERKPGGEPPNDEPPDTGEPVTVLSDLEVPPSAGFFARLRNKIERRSLVGQVIVLSWHLPRMVLLEFLEMIFGLVAPKDQRKGGSR